jgi:Fe2+ or Zn2+ uptake regulation protein
MKKNISRRATKQRKIILEELRRVRTHPTADSIFKMVRKRLPSISFGTVYRNLNLLKDEGKILELTCGKYSCHYDGNPQMHYHFFCLHCGKIFDIEELNLEDLNKMLNKKSDFVARYHRLDFYGYCGKCYKKLKKVNNQRAGTDERRI